MSKSQEKLFSMLANSTSKGYLIKGYTKRINQFIPNNFINVSANTSVVPTSNKCGSYITIITPTNLVGHKVFAKITTDSIFIKCCWYKTLQTAYDFATGDLLSAISQPIVPLSGIYEITNDMVYGDGYLQLYWWVYQGCPTGMHSLTIQLVDLTEIYGVGNEPTSVSDFIADYPLFSNGTYNYTGVAGDLISAKAPFVATKDESILPSGYTELEWIRGGGNSRYIDTLIKVSKNDFEMELKFIPENTIGQDACIIGLLNYFSISYYNSTSGGEGLYFGKSFNPNLPTDNTKSYTIKIKNDTYTDYQGDETQLTYNNISSNDTIWLFNRNKKFTNATNIKICELYLKNDTGEVHLIPCINDQNEVGMYDLVSQTFFGNQGTGDFIAGPVVNRTKSFVYIPSSNFELDGAGTTKSTLSTAKGTHTKKSDITNLAINSKDGESFLGTYLLADRIWAIGIPDNRFVCSRYKTYADNATYNEGISPIPTPLLQSIVQVRVYDRRFRDYTLAQMQAEQQGVKICYPLATSTTEKVNSIHLPKGITKIVDTYGVELEFEEL